MPYATQPQIVIACGGQTAFDQLFDYDGDGVADVDVIAQAQAAADAIIDAKIPAISDPSPVLQMLAAEETVYQARKWRPALGGDVEQEKKHHEQRMSMLDAIRDGKARATPNQSNAGEFIENTSPMSRARSKGSLW